MLKFLLIVQHFLLNRYNFPYKLTLVAYSPLIPIESSAIVEYFVLYRVCSNFLFETKKVKRMFNE